MSIRERQQKMMEKGAESITRWIGSTASVLLHTVLFIVSFSLPYFKVTTFERMLLFLTTIVSLEAIYLSIFIQMSLNMNNQNIEIIQEDIEELSGDIEEISEDIEEISEDIEEISGDIEELGEDLEEIGEDIEEIQKDVVEMQEDVEEIQKDVEEIQEDVVEMQEELQEDEEVVISAEEVHVAHDDGQYSNPETTNTQLLLSIQATLRQLQKEIEQLKNPG